jgi:hypothetical protein
VASTFVKAAETERVRRIGLLMNIGADDPEEGKLSQLSDKNCNG